MIFCRRMIQKRIIVSSEFYETLCGKNFLETDNNMNFGQFTGFVVTYK